MNDNITDVGRDVECICRDLVQNANGNIAMAELGIIYIDEIDKISRKGENLSTTADPGHEGVQQGLLKMLEGSVVEVPEKGQRLHPQSNNVMRFNTENVLFVVGGAFEGLEKIIAKRLRSGNSSMGFGSPIVDKNNDQYNDFILQVTTEDLKKFGMLPEFLGRIPVLSPMQELTEEQLVEILTEPKNALVKQYQLLLKQDGVELEFSEAALKAVAHKAIERKVGARGLRGILEAILNPIMFDVPDTDDSYILIDADKNGEIIVSNEKSKVA